MDQNEAGSEAFILVTQSEVVATHNCGVEGCLVVLDDRGRRAAQSLVASRLEKIA